MTVDPLIAAIVGLFTALSGVVGWVAAEWRSGNMVRGTDHAKVVKANEDLRAELDDAYRERYDHERHARERSDSLAATTVEGLKAVAERLARNEERLERIEGQMTTTPPPAPEEGAVVMFDWLRGRHAAPVERDHEPAIHRSRNVRQADNYRDTLSARRHAAAEERARRLIDEIREPSGEPIWDMLTGTWRPKGDHE